MAGTRRECHSRFFRVCKLWQPSHIFTGVEICAHSHVSSVQCYWDASNWPTPRQSRFQPQGDETAILSRKREGMVSFQPIFGSETMLLGALEHFSMFFHMVVSWNRGTPKSSNLVGFSIKNHPLWGTLSYGNLHTLGIFGNNHPKWLMIFQRGWNMLKPSQTSIHFLTSWATTGPCR